MNEATAIDGGLLVAAGLLLLLVFGLWAFYAGTSYLHQEQRLRQRFALFAARDRLYRLVAENRLRCDTDLFLSAVRFVNFILHRDEEVGWGLEHMMQLERITVSEEGRDAATKALASWSQEEKDALTEVLVEIADAMSSLARTNSHFYRVLPSSSLSSRAA